MEERILNFGGFNHEIFLNLSKRERLEFSCSICRYILNQPRQCCNGHLYCFSCIGEWKKRGNKTCPACGADASVKENVEIDSAIGSKYVRCEAEQCPWKGRLERLNHHETEVHGSCAESRASTAWESLSSDERLAEHKLVHEVIKSHSIKKEAIIRRIRKVEKMKRRELLERESAQTVVPESMTSRSEMYRPFSDIVTYNPLDKSPQVKWSTLELNKDNFYHRINRIENTKSKRREMTYKKVEQLERRKQNELGNLFRKIEDLERQREENRAISEQRIIQIERKMKDGREAFERQLREKEKRRKAGQEQTYRRVNVVRVKLKK